MRVLCDTLGIDKPIVLGWSWSLLLPAALLHRLYIDGVSYRYVGPAEVKAAIRPGGEGRPIRTRADFESWVRERPAAESAEPFTLRLLR
ncbi:hypothetical protein C1J01_32330 [Nonomuraea aridisoli]|uniref:Uncharacterized protein n=1 Tax=Nonomuraea aridisoli TaxID=2070368 RepID=A0A2W2EGA2_9ACTN|nr:hypothetical protein C1J01_32330 [Nonomuraea aridisoli]